jgi:bis(5'-nucleosyl)-tetraphosphatase (symmetrical)
MATFAIGDIQGCYQELIQLLDKLHFNPARDNLWFTGDLVNRGPQSLEVLRFVKGLGEGAMTVLGNHDLHLLAVSMNRQRHFKASDTLQSVLAAPDREDLIGWLRTRPLLHHEEGIGWTMVHAGLPPQWDLDTARGCAREVEAALRGEDFPAFIDHMYGNEPLRWSPALRGWERLRYAVNCFTRLRFVSRDGDLELTRKGPPDSDGAYLPWFRAPNRLSANTPLIFGHWSTLGFYRDNNICALDSGCLWGGRLTAVRLDDGSLTATSVPCAGARIPGEE